MKLFKYRLDGALHKGNTMYEFIKESHGHVTGKDLNTGKNRIFDGRFCDYLILYICSICGEEHYFSMYSLPGGDEHCEYCEHCSRKLEKAI
jgi:hypothetical protein